MASYCLPRAYADKFKQALRRGDIDLDKLSAMSSAERRAAFNRLVGEDNARNVNALFESKLLLKNQKAGLTTWARNVAGLGRPARRELLDKIERMDKILQPADEKVFLADLASKRIGVQITSDEAKKIWALSENARKRLDIANGDLNNKENRIQFGLAQLDLLDAIESMKPNGNTLLQRFLQVPGLPRALMTFGDFSAFINQGWGTIFTKRAWQGFYRMFQYAFSENEFRRLQADIISHPEYQLAKKAGLGLTDLSSTISKREEAIQFTLAEEAEQWASKKIGLKNGGAIRMSSRAFAGYLNYVRFNRFVDLVAAARLMGEDISTSMNGAEPSKGFKNARDIAKVVNDFSGRGNLGVNDAFGSSAPFLNAMFFAPRKVSASINMLNPQRYLDPRISRTARIAATKQMLGSLIATAALLSLAAAMGADVELDPTATDFARFKVGNTTFDPTGGMASYIKLLARTVFTNKYTDKKGKTTEYGSSAFAPTRGDAVGDFVRGKFAPLTGFFADMFYGEDGGGNAFTYPKQAQDKLLPMTFNTFYDFAQDEPEKFAGAIPMLLTLLGVSAQTETPPEKKRPRGEENRLKRRSLFEVATGQDG
jgi:hypothetical protein